MGCGGSMPLSVHDEILEIDPVDKSSKHIILCPLEFKDLHR